MKKLLTLIVVTLFATATFAQDKMKRDEAASAYKHECYMMQKGNLMHCMGDKTEVQKTEVKLKDGTVLSTTGEYKMKDGRTGKLENGTCMTAMGKVGDCEKMHAAVAAPKKVEQVQPVPADPTAK
jgi:hypothetical protein